MSESQRLQSTTLFSKEGGADKQYTVWIEQRSGGFVVAFQFGPRGGWVQGGTKTPAPVPRDKAEKIHAKLVAEKKAKGYSIGEDAPAFAQVEGAVDTGIRPMLLTADDEASIDKYLAAKDWAAQEKMNGKRILVKVGDGKAAGVNRRGLECPIPVDVAKAVVALQTCVLDGELIGQSYHVFDLLQDADGDRRKMPMQERFDAAKELVADLDAEFVSMVELAVGKSDKRELVDGLRSGRKEGVVFKKLDGLYVPGRVENLAKAAAIKIEFYAEGEFVVVKWNDKQSVALAAFDGGKQVSVGNVTVAAKYAKQIAVGGVVRVKYLYATPGRQLYQPSLDPADDGSVVRTDVRPAECSIVRLKFEGKDEE